MNRVIDYSALLYPVPPERIRDFKNETRTRGVSWGASQAAEIIGAAVSLAVLAGMLIVGIAIFAGVAAASARSGPTPVGVLGSLFLALWVGFIVVIGFAIIRGIFSDKQWETWLRLDTFAKANGLVFSPRDRGPSYPGAIFGIGDSRLVTNHLTSATERYLDIGNYQYTTGSGDNRTTRRWGFMALHLDRKLPHIVLDSKANNGLFGGSNLPATFDKNQVLSLEGDFDKYFTLYCPRQYERDALYIFTPDLMALLIDNAAPFDVEIVEDWMFVYSQTPFPSTSPALYQRLFRIIDTVGAKTLSQTERYVDERIGDFAANYVAPQGQRLKRGWSVGAVIALVVFLAVWGLPQLFGLLALFGF